MIERLDIENLGPIGSATIELTPLTVLLGANASGKTSVLRAFELFAGIRRHPLGQVEFGSLSLTGDRWASIVHRGDETRLLRFRAWTGASQERADYEVSIGIDWDAARELVTSARQEAPRPGILQESLREAPDVGGWLETGAGEFELRTLRVKPSLPRDTSLPVTLESVAKHPAMAAPLGALIAFARSFGDARYFKPVGSALVTLTADARVWPTGEGFVGALAAWQNARVEEFLRLEQALQAIFPHIRRVRILQPDRERNRHVLEFETSRSQQLTPAELEADGVLTTLFLLWAAFTTGKDGILLLDDPEAGLHPHLMGQRVAFLRSLADGTITGTPVRVVAATQSVEFARYLDLSEVRIVEHDPAEGTRVRRVPRDETVATLLDTYQRNVGELWYSGAIGGLPELRR